MAARRGNILLVKMLLEAGANVAAVDKEGYTALHISANEGYFTIVLGLISAGGQPDQKNVLNGHTPLILASSRGHLAVVEALMAAGSVDINSTSSEGHAPLHWAARNGHASVMRALLAAGAEINKETRAGLTALHVAAAYGQVDAVKELLAVSDRKLDSMDKQGETALHKAITRGHEDVVQLLLFHGAVIDAALPATNAAGVNVTRDLFMSDPTNASSQQAVTPAVISSEVAVAAGGGERQTGAATAQSHEPSSPRTPRDPIGRKRRSVKMTLEEGSGVGDVDEEGRTPLHIAVLLRMIDSVKLLIEFGAALDVVDGNGNTALHMAARIGSEQTMELLLKAHADPDIKNKHNLVPLHFAARFGHGGCVVMLLVAGCNPRLPTSPDYTQGLTALHLAAYHGHAQCLHALLSGGAVAERPGMGGVTPLHLAAVNSHHQCIVVLLTSGANIDAVDDRGITPLHLAASAGHIQVLKHLLENGVSVDRTDMHGSSALHYAITMQQFEAIQLLLSAGADRNLVNNEGYAAINSPIYVRAQPTVSSEPQILASVVTLELPGTRGLGEFGPDRQLAQIEEIDDSGSASQYGTLPSTVKDDGSTAATSVTGSAVEVKRWKYSMPDNVGQPGSGAPSNAFNAYLAFGAASGTGDADGGEMRQIDAAAQLDTYLTGIQGMTSGAHSVSGASVAPSAMLSTVAATEVSQGALSKAPSAVGTYVSSQKCDDTASVVSSDPSVFTALEEPTDDWDKFSTISGMHTKRACKSAL